MNGTDTQTFSDTFVELANHSTPRLIKVIGVGGGGGNAVAQMYRDNIPEVRYVVVNTDSKALSDNPVPDHLQLGPGLGAGGNPVKGRELAQESIDKIQEILDDETKMVFITAGMGGGTGTGASPVIAHEARAKGILTIGIVTIPFLFERKRQIDKALDGLEALAAEVDALLVINNQRLCEIYPDLSIINAFKCADKTLSTAVSSITEVIDMHGRVILDFEDVRNTLTNGGIAVMSTGYGEGENRVTKAIHDAITSPLLNNNDVFAASRILLSITTSTDDSQMLQTYEMNEVEKFMAKFDSDVEAKWGLTLNPELGNKIKITIIASGYKLYEPKSAKQKAEIEWTVESGERDTRRDRFYGTKGKTVKSKPNVYLFSADDLLNDNIVDQVENTPTRKRGVEQLKQIKKMSAAAEQGE